MENGGKILVRLLLALACLFGLGTPAMASAPIETCVAPLTPVSAQPLQYDCGANQARLGPGDFAVQLRFAPMLSDPDNPLVLRTTSVWQQSQRLVFHYADGTTSELDFSSATARHYMTIGAIFEFKVPSRAAPLDGIYAEIKGSANWRGVMLGAELMPQDRSFRLQSYLTWLYAAFAGLSLTLIVYNLSLWTVLRHRFQLSYTAMVAAMMAYTFTASSLVMLVIPSLANNDRLRINYVLLALTLVAGVRFMLDFFGPRVVGPRFARLIGVSSAAALISGIAFAALAPWQGLWLDRFYFLTSSLVLFLIVPLIVAAWRARVRNFGLFLLAWSAPVLVSFARAAHGLGLIGYSFWLDNGNLIALSIESLLSILLIVGRLRELARERDQARASEQSALRLANSDPLTGLLNRRAFIHKAVGRAAAHRLLLVDIDHFKAINDRLGHDAGDDVLCAVAEVLQECRPPESLAVRLGGEEFALLIPLQHQRDCPPERILNAIRAKAMPLDWKVTVSLGFADGKVSSEEDWKRLYRLADAALYRAKADGRDRACRATDFAAVGAA